MGRFDFTAADKRYYKKQFRLDKARDAKLKAEQERHDKREKQIQDMYFKKLHGR